MAVSVFPRSTLLDHVSFVSKIRIESDDRTQRWIKKYENRGFTVVGATSDSVMDSMSHIIYGRRNILDGHSWKIRLDGEDPNFYIFDIGFFLTISAPCFNPLRGIFGPMRIAIDFEVMSHSTGVVPDGSILRVAEPMVWR